MISGLVFDRKFFFSTGLVTPPVGFWGEARRNFPSGTT